MLTIPSPLRLPQPIRHWRSLCHLSGAPEAALVSARCRFSLSTVEVMCNPSALFCALVEQEHPETWRWAVYGPEDNALDEGTVPTHARARRAAIRSLVVLNRAGIIKLHSRQPAAPALSPTARPEGEALGHFASPTGAQLAAPGSESGSTSR